MAKSRVLITTIIVLGLTILFICATYAAWYSYDRQVKIAQIEKCASKMEHPDPPTTYVGPDGNIVSVMISEPCLIIPIPPSLWNLLRGRLVFEGVHDGLEVNPYSLKDILLGNYTLGPGIDLPCDQSATTTPCATLEALKAAQPPVPAQYTVNTNEPVGTISTTTSGQTSYVNKNMGLTFEFPQDWHLGMNTLGDASGHGYLQLFNYDEHQADGKSVFSEGHNKIEAGISSEDTYGTSSDYPEKSRVTKKITVSGQPATLVDIELGGQNIRNYSIELPSSSGKLFSISIYGDPKNFEVLDNLIKSFKWIPSPE